MLLFKVSESTAVRRRVPIHCVDVTDGYTPEAGEAGGQPQIAKLGGVTPAFANTGGVLVNISSGTNGSYYVELTAAELDTIGTFIVRYKSANTREFQVVCQCVSFDPYDATALGISRLDAAISACSTLTTADIVTQVGTVLNTAIPGAPTADSINERIATLDGNFTSTVAGNLDASISTRATPAQVNTEVSDVLKTDTITEQPVGKPSATPTLEQAIGYLFMAWRNKATATSSELKYHNDAGANLCKSALSDDGTTFTREELAAP